MPVVLIKSLERTTGPYITMAYLVGLVADIQFKMNEL